MQNRWPPYPFDQPRNRTHQNTLAHARARVLNFETKDKSAIPLNSVVLRHFVSLSVSLKNKGLSDITAKPLILW